MVNTILGGRGGGWVANNSLEGGWLPPQSLLIHKIGRKLTVSSPV